MTMRVLVYSIGQSLPFAMTLKLLLAKHDGRVHPGARLAGVISCLIIAIYAIRAIGNLAGIDISFARSSMGQGVLTLGLIFLSMAFNFGFLLMAIDRLRNEVADLALLDDLTGVGNRRHAGAAAHRGMRALGAQRRAVRAAGDRPRRLQAGQRHPWPCRGRRLPAAFHPDGADAAARPATCWRAPAATSSASCCRPRPCARAR